MTPTRRSGTLSRGTGSASGGGRVAGDGGGVKSVAGKAGWASRPAGAGVTWVEWVTSVARASGERGGGLTVWPAGLGTGGNPMRKGGCCAEGFSGGAGEGLSAAGKFGNGDCWTGRTG